MPYSLVSYCDLCTHYRQRLDKHISEQADSLNNTTFVARQRVSKQAFLTIEDDVFREVRAKWL
jgi:hypothetical protein